MFKSLRHRISVMFVLLVLCAEAVVGVLVTIGTINDYHTAFEKTFNEVFSDDMRKYLTDTSQMVATSATTPAMHAEAKTNTAFIIRDSIKGSDLFKSYPGLRLAILDDFGEIKYSEIEVESLEKSEAIKMAAGGTETLINPKLGKNIEFAMPIKNNDLVSYVVYIYDPMTVQMRIVKRIIAMFLILIPFLVVVALITSMLFARSVSKPIKALSDKAKRLADGDDNALFPAVGKDEISELTNAFLYLAQSKKELTATVTDEKNKLETILQNMKDGIMAFDSEGKLTHINPEAMRLLNRQFVDDIVFNKFFKEINADITLEAVRFQQSDEGIERQVTINNQILQLSFARVLQELGGGGVIVIIHDVTKHEKLERARLDFVANVSHELRTPLTVIKSYSDILADTPDADPQTRTRFLDTISSETDRMARIISDLLTLSSLDAGTNHTRPTEEIDIRNMLEGLVERLSLSAKKREQTLTYTPINDVPKIKGDRGALERVFTNIISNALKYTPSGGSVEIFSSQVYNDILIKVSDTGIGISKEQLPHIFDRFYRVDKARSRDKGGTGLGLAIAKQTVETTFRGKILITSELNKGTDVTVTLPIKKK